ncbi:MAG: OmpA family protein [Candidatus Eisenbacteria bacterium]|uniref:OmpA family protein n=1 Tax=Eiseniibacteriota bacterium TaxID=2212470 RepID=A0A538T4S9_UNCEI|nr:MAG: OmpA family protein [Candidatus Eisenbacteria bacterium]TMQ58630.1 MAG: OmpA family protein [Candidatus Eisenbacteria bacterium]
MQIRKHSAALRAALAVLLVVSGMAGCSSWSKEKKGAIIGAASGGALGAVIGNATGSTARGAIIGAVVGGAAGTIIGHRMDKQAQELQQNIPGAIVRRVGEGIEVTFASGLLFDFDSDRIRGEARRNLDELARSLDKYPDTDLLIVGHTDAVGADQYNMGLSERRADSAARYIESQGVRTGIRTVGRGKREPVASNESDYGRQKNRRVEVAIYASDALRSQAEREAASR